MLKVRLGFFKQSQPLIKQRLVDGRDQKCALLSIITVQFSKRKKDDVIIKSTWHTFTGYRVGILGALQGREYNNTQYVYLLFWHLSVTINSIDYR